jgi:hypothetical protein
MALTALQRHVCRLLADDRRRRGESYVAGGLALNELLGASRLSRDVDLFHDSEHAVAASWASDRDRLSDAGFAIEVIRERPGFVEAEASRDGESVRMEWARDSAFRFFPLVEHADLGLALHPFDLATNKLLAAIGRREPRDWVDLVECDRRLQPLGYLAWAACGKDPAFGPAAILEQVARSNRYTAEELAELSFAGPPPDPVELSRRWHAALDAATAIVSRLPSEHAGTCVLLGDDLCRLPAGPLADAAAAGRLRFRSGSIGGALPTIRPPH